MAALLRGYKRLEAGRIPTCHARSCVTAGFGSARRVDQLHRAQGRACTAELATGNLLITDGGARVRSGYEGVEAGEKAVAATRSRGRTRADRLGTRSIRWTTFYALGRIRAK